MYKLGSLATIAVILLTQNAYAYLDPGTGSIILQGLIAGIAGGLITIKLYWAKFKSLFKSKQSKKDDSGQK